MTDEPTKLILTVPERTTRDNIYEELREWYEAVCARTNNDTAEPESVELTMVKNALMAMTEV